MHLLNRFRLTEIGGLLTCFLVGFTVRMVPELLAFPHPIGFDTIYYAAVMKGGVVWPHWTAFFTSSWLFPAVSVSLYRVFDGDPFALLKVLAPLLFGLNVAGIFWFARKMLGWSTRMDFFAGLFFAFQLASLRISWDLLRNALGLGLLLFTLPFVKSVDSKRGFACFVLLSLLTVFAHEYAAVTLLFVVFGLVLWSGLKREGLAKSKRLLLACSPALAVFAVGIFLRFFPVHYVVETNVLRAGDADYARVGGIFFLTNYLSVKTSVDWYASYFDLALSVVLLFCLLYLPYLFLVWKGFFKNRVLSLWTALLLVGAFGCLVFPFCALEYWHRWMFMLVYPFAFYAVNGLRGFMGNYDGGSLGLGGAFSDRKVKGMVLLTVLLGSVYLATPVLMSTVNFGVFAFNPVNRYFSFAPTVPYEDVDDVVRAMEWLNENMGSESCVVLQHAFLWWGKLYLGDNHVIVHFENDVGSALDSAFEHGFDRVYFVWWNTPIGWYGITVPEGFVRLCDFGRISVYVFGG
ncbi:MAG: hypothetical protein QXK98_04955 [Candidatus Bathyarchaeia archaeon]